MRRAFYLDLSIPLFESEDRLKSYFANLNEISKYIQRTRNIKFYISITLDFITSSKKHSEELLKVLKDLYENERVEFVIKDNFEVFSTAMGENVFEFNSILNEYLEGYLFGSKKNFEGDSSIMIKDLNNYHPFRSQFIKKDIELFKSLGYRKVFIDSSLFNDSSFIYSSLVFVSLNLSFKDIFTSFINKETLENFLNKDISKSYEVLYLSLYDIFLVHPEEFLINISNTLHILDLTDRIEYRFADESFEMPVKKDLNSLLDKNLTYSSFYEHKELYEAQKALGSHLITLEGDPNAAEFEEFRAAPIWEVTSSDKVNDYLRINFIIMTLLSYSIDSKLKLLNDDQKSHLSVFLKEVENYSKTDKTLTSVIENLNSIFNQK